jgi:hypothetical protein
MPEFGPDKVCADHVRPALLAWKAAVEAKGGKLKVNSMTRTVAQQQPFRDAYMGYLSAKAKWEKGGEVGKAPTPVAAANKPGKSGHQGGISDDVNTVGAFPHAPADQQVDLLWATAKPCGFTPIIDKPDETKSERWHFDYWGHWAGVKAHFGAETAYLCSALDVGQAGEWQSDDRLTQALLLRAGFDIGEPDGIAGKRTAAALVLALGADHVTRYPTIVARFTALRALPADFDWIVVKG